MFASLGWDSALDFLPDQLKAQMVDTDEKRSEFKCLGETVGSVSSEDALKLFHEYVQDEEIGENKGRSLGNFTIRLSVGSTSRTKNED
ncbi:hypothetical protein Dimus_030058 [Dionaea muscipula]